MSLFHLLPIAQSKISLLIQTSGALFLILNFYSMKKIATTVSNRATFTTLAAIALKVAARS